MGWVELDVTSPYFIGPGDGWPPAENTSIIAYPKDTSPIYSPARNLTVTIASLSASSVFRGEGQIIVNGFVLDELGNAVRSVPVSIYMNSSDGKNVLLRLGSATTNEDGYYKAICLVPWNASLGTCSIVARAHGLNDDITLWSYVPSWSSTFSELLTITARLYIDISGPNSVFNGSSLPITGTLSDWNLKTYNGFDISLWWDDGYIQSLLTNETGSFNTTSVVNDTAGLHYVTLKFNGTSLISPVNKTVIITVRHNLTLNMSTATNSTSAGSEAVFSGTIRDGFLSPSLVDSSITGVWLIYDGDYVAQSDITPTGGFRLNFTILSATIPGVKPVAVYFPESDFYSWIYLSMNLTVYGNCTLSVDAAGGVRNNTINITGIVRNLQNIPLENMTVTVQVNRSELRPGLTDGNGVFCIPFHKPRGHFF
jgi:hypothetical protein